MMSPIFKTIIFLGSLTALLVGMGYAIGGREAAFFCFIFSMLLNFGAYWFSDRIALKMAGAKPIDQADAPGLYSDIQSLASQMNLPMPKVYYVPHLQANAFATGRSPNHSAICVTQGLLNILDRKEVKGVLAHELAHIKNRDVLIATIAAVLAGTISGLADLAIWLSAARNNNEERAANPLAQLAFIIVAPLAAFLLQMAVSRQREFAADETGAKLTGHAHELARALEKIDASVRALPMDTHAALSPLYIENPLKSSRIMSLFSTHPPIQERIARLSQLH